MSKFSFTDKLIFLWLIIDLLVHGVLEASFVYFSLTTTVAKAQPTSQILKWLLWTWVEYGTNADSKWLILDPCIVSVELLTCTLDTLLCAIILYTVCCFYHDVNNIYLIVMKILFKIIIGKYGMK